MPGVLQDVIDRMRLVRRHEVRLNRLDQHCPLTLGNGEFGIALDITGLQSFPEHYAHATPLGTMSTWGWHRDPPPEGLDPRHFTWIPLPGPDRPVPYAYPGSERWFDHKPAYWPLDPKHEQLGKYLYENPHRIHLGHVGFLMRHTNGQSVQAEELTDIEQRLDLWTGILHSRFVVAGQRVEVRTCCHPNLDLVAVTVRSGLLDTGRLAIRLQFAAATPHMRGYDPDRPNRHQTRVIHQSDCGLDIFRQQDGSTYHVTLVGGRPITLQQIDAHTVLAQPRETGEQFDAVCGFSKARGSVSQWPGADQTFTASAQHWERYWCEGGALDMSACGDPRAAELERRVVLSQYLTAVHCSGSLPPQESGFVHNSWCGKFHLEVHWWHATQLALWGRLPLLERSLGWYESILPVARKTAKLQGYDGVRWPKQVGPDAMESPCSIGPMLVWQQPHPIVYAEYCYRAHPQKSVLLRWLPIVEQTADFMASYAVQNLHTGRFELAPPIIPMAENHDPMGTLNPCFELAYFGYALDVAQTWRKRLHLSRVPRWDQVREGLAPLPVDHGLYLVHQHCAETYSRFNRDHPAMLAAYGMIPGHGVDQRIMRATLHKVVDTWQWDEAWAFDFAIAAMCAARLDEPELAVDLLLMNARRHRYNAAGLCAQFAFLPAFLPANASLLAAAGMMAGGWDDSPPNPAPGFPRNKLWDIRAEGIQRML